MRSPGIRRALAAAVYAAGTVTLSVSVATAQQWTFIRYAGSPGGRGVDDGPAAVARFNRPAGMAVDSAGNLYVADTGNHTIRKIASSGDVTTLAGLAGQSGNALGRGGYARFNSPKGIVCDPQDNLFVADSGNHRIVKITPAGDVTLYAGGTPGELDGIGAEAQFLEPSAIALASGEFYVTDAGAGTIRKITAGAEVSTFLDGLTSPVAIAMDPTSGAFYVIEAGHGDVSVWSSVTEDLPPIAAFSQPAGLTLDASGVLYVTDADGHTIRAGNSTASVSTFAGALMERGSADGSGAAARFDTPTAITRDAAGNLYVSDEGNGTIRKITPAGGVTTFTGVATIGTDDGTGGGARFTSVGGIACDSSGNVFVSEPGVYTIRKIAPGGVVTTFAGSAGSPGTDDGVGGAARFMFPEGLTVDTTGNLYVADVSAHTIRKATADREVSTFAGAAGVPGTAAGPPLSSARFTGPAELATDPATGVMYVVESDSSIRTIAGGAAPYLFLNAGAGAISVGSSNTLWFTPRNGFGDFLTQVDASTGVPIRTVGAEQGYLDGTIEAARFRTPTGLAFDPAAGALYIADSGNNVIRRLDTAVTTVAGGSAPVSVDGSGSFARFDAPSAVAVDSTGTIYVVDGTGRNIRRGRPALADVAVVSAGSADVGVARQLDTAPQTATSWEWTIIRRPAGSTATLSSPSIRNPTFTPDLPDHYTFRLTASDGTSTSITEVTLNAMCLVMVNAASLPRAFFGESYSETITANGGVAPYSFTIDGGALPGGLTLSSAGLISGAPTERGSFSFVVRATDSAGCSAAETFTIEVNRTPVARSGAAYVTENLASAVLMRATDPDNDPLTFTVVTAPSHGTLSAGPGAARTFTPEPGYRGADSFTFQASDGFEQSGVATISINIVPALSGTLTFRHVAGPLVGPRSDGALLSARFETPACVRRDGSGNLYVCDGQVIRRITSAGDVTTLAGGAAERSDAAGFAAGFRQPSGAAFDASGNVYVADAADHTIRKITPTGLVSTFAGRAGESGNTDGPGTQAAFNGPTGIAIDALGNLFVADQNNGRIRKITPAGDVTTFAGSALGFPVNGTGTSAVFAYPTAIAFDAAGNLHVAELSGLIRRVSPSAVVTTTAGIVNNSAGYADGSPGRFYGPRGITVDGDGNIFVADTGNHLIRKITSGVVSTVAGLPGDGGSVEEGYVDGPAETARFRSPVGIVVDAAGNLYVAEPQNRVIRMITAGGVVSTYAGVAPGQGYADGPGRAARFARPSGAAVDGADNVYVADTQNHTIRKITPGHVVSTFAGAAGQAGWVDGTGSAARFAFPVDIASDDDGNLYVAEPGAGRIRKISAAGEVTTLTVAGFSSSPAEARYFENLRSLSADRSGNLYVHAGDFPSSVIVLDSAGVQTEAIDLGEVDEPTGVAVDPGGTTLYLARGTVVKYDLSTGTTTELTHIPSVSGVDAAGHVWFITFEGTIERCDAVQCVPVPAAPPRLHEMPADPPHSLSIDVHNGLVYVVNNFANTISVGVPAVQDVATATPADVDIGVPVQLDTTPATATAWQWTMTRRPTGSAAALSSATIRNPIFTPDVLDRYVFRVVASDGAKQSISEVIIEPPCLSALLLPGTLPKAFPGIAYSQTLSRTAGFAPFTFTVIDGALPPGLTLSSVGLLSGNPTGGGPYTFSIRSNDLVGCVATATYTVVVNRPPTATSFTYSTLEDSPVGVVLGGTDPDGDPLIPAVLVPPSSGTLSGTGQNRTYTPAADFNGGDGVIFSISDGGAHSMGNHFFVVVPVNDQPVVPAIADREAILEDAGEQTVAISGMLAGPPDESAQLLAVTATSSNTSLISTVSVSTTAPGAVSLSYTPQPNAHGLATIEVSVQDDGGVANGGSDTTVRSFVVAVTPVNDAPVLAFIGNRMVSAGTALGFNVAADDVDGDTITYTSTTLPAGAVLTIDGVFSWTPEASQAGSHVVTITASDGNGGSDSETVTITVSVVELAAPSGIVATATDSATITVSWTGVDGAAGYEVFRIGRGGAAILLGSAAVSPYADDTAVVDTAYLYYVRAVDGAGNRSPNSTADLGTMVLFADDPIVPGTTPVRANHFVQLRTAINAVRWLAGLDVAGFTDASLPGQAIRAVHVGEMRTALDAARGTLLLSDIGYAEEIVPGTTVKASHIMELRNGVR